MWDPAQYLRFSGERSRPFFELTGQIRAGSPGLVVDLGCGPGQLTAALASRWPDAEVQGIDSSEEMIASARQLGRELAAQRGGEAGRPSFARGDVRDWR